MARQVTLSNVQTLLRVPTDGKSGKILNKIPGLEKSGNLKKIGQFREKSGNLIKGEINQNKNQGILLWDPMQLHLDCCNFTCRKR